MHHVALLIGYGAAAVNPYLAFEPPSRTSPTGASWPASTRKTATRNLIKALGKGVLKVMSKMGISTVASYTGAQVFEAIGLGPELVDSYFTGTASRLDGVGLDDVGRRGRDAAIAGPTHPAGVRPAAPRAGDRRRVPVAPRG